MGLFFHFSFPWRFSMKGASNLGGPRRFHHVVIFWLQCEQVSVYASSVSFKYKNEKKN
jgi:hypothetical protein